MAIFYYKRSVLYLCLNIYSLTILKKLSFFLSIQLTSIYFVVLAVIIAITVLAYKMISTNISDCRVYLLAVIPAITNALYTEQEAVAARGLPADTSRGPWDLTCWGAGTIIIQALVTWKGAKEMACPRVETPRHPHTAKYFPRATSPTWPSRQTRTRIVLIAQMFRIVTNLLFTTLYLKIINANCQIF